MGEAGRQFDYRAGSRDNVAASNNNAAPNHNACRYHHNAGSNDDSGTDYHNPSSNDNPGTDDHDAGSNDNSGTDDDAASNDNPGADDAATNHNPGADDAATNNNPGTAATNNNPGTAATNNNPGTANSLAETCEKAAEGNMVNGQSILKVSPGIVSEAIEGEYLLFHPKTGGTFLLNSSAALIIGLCDGTRSARTICEMIGDGYLETTGTIDGDVIDTLTYFEEQGLLVSE